MVSDAMITGEQLSIEFEQRTPKISKLTDHCVASTAVDACIEQSEVEVFACMHAHVPLLN